MGLKELILPTKLSEISTFSFNDFNSLESITIPATVKEIGESAFQRCMKLKNIVLQEGTTTLGNESFGQCINLDYIYIPESVNEKFPLTKIKREFLCVFNILDTISQFHCILYQARLYPYTPFRTHSCHQPQSYRFRDHQIGFGHY